MQQPATKHAKFYLHYHSFIREWNVSLLIASSNIIFGSYSLPRIFDNRYSKNHLYSVRIMQMIKNTLLFQYCQEYERISDIFDITQMQDSGTENVR